MLLWIVNFMLFLFLFSFFKKTKPTGSRPHHMAREVQRNAEERNNTGSLPSVQHTMWCLFSNKSKPWFCGLLQLAFHTADPPKGISMSCHHLQSLLQLHQNPDPLGSQLTPPGSIGLPITVFLLYLLSPRGFCKPHSSLFLSHWPFFLSLLCSFLFFLNLLECPRAQSWASLSKWAHSILWLFFF